MSSLTWLTSNLLVRGGIGRTSARLGLGRRGPASPVPPPGDPPSSGRRRRRACAETSAQEAEGMDEKPLAAAQRAVEREEGGDGDVEDETGQHLAVDLAYFS